MPTLSFSVGGVTVGYTSPRSLQPFPIAWQCIQWVDKWVTTHSQTQHVYYTMVAGTCGKGWFGGVQWKYIRVRADRTETVGVLQGSSGWRSAISSSGYPRSVGPGKAVATDLYVCCGAALFLKQIKLCLFEAYGTLLGKGVSQFCDYPTATHGNSGISIALGTCSSTW